MPISATDPLPAGETVAELASRKSLNERQIEAARKFRDLYLELSSVGAELGDRHYRLLVSVVGQDHSLAEITGNKRGRLTAIDNLRESLDDLAGLWRLATRRPGDGTRRVGGSGNAR